MGHHSNDSNVKRLRWRRVRALLASGLVLGVGSAITLAAWNDSEHGTATFTAGEFDIQGAEDGSTFTDHPTQGDAAALVFNVPAVDMVPGQTVYAPFSVRTAPGSVAGTAQLTANSDNGDGLGQWLRYGVRTTSGTTCNEAAFNAGTEVVPANSALAVGSAATQSLPADASGQVNYCFAITLPADTPNAAQGAVLTAHWEFVGLSASQ